VALYDVPAPAKLNLFLHVVGRRPDGYHLLQTVFRFIDLCDALDLDERADGRITCENPALPEAGSDDLVVRAALALQQATGVRQGAHIVCRKRIPMGGGLGGGSSDAASTLIALNRLWRTNLSRADLMRLALPLGADVPVFVFGQPAFAQGVGEALSPVALPQRAYVVAQPDQQVPTSAIFAADELTRNSQCVKISVFAEWQGGAGARVFGRNDLEPVACAMYPRVGQMADWLRACGYHVRMTGSGACFFAEFVTMDQARRCHRDITAEMPTGRDGTPVIRNSWVCAGLSDHPLRHWIRS